ncbi:MAG: tetratricopeptide repeat protein, partial [Planctomycetaceae bacterium]
MSKRLFLIVAAAAIGCGVIYAWKPVWIGYRIDRARQALDARDADSAVTWLTANVHLDPQDADTRFWLARAYRRLGRFDDVRQQIERAWKLGYPVEALQREQWLALAQSGQFREA